MSMADYYEAKDADPAEWPAEDYNVMAEYYKAKDAEDD
jgi:hypothetical protein